jgi:hypothetical protein
MIHRPSLDDFLDRVGPHATFHDAELVSLAIDFEKKELVTEWKLCVGDPDAATETERERRRRGRLWLTGLLFWVVEPPGDLDREPDPPWLTDDGPLREAPTETGKRLAALLPPGVAGWYLFFTDWNAFAYCGAAHGSFEWTE